MITTTLQGLFYGDPIFFTNIKVCMYDVIIFLNFCVTEYNLNMIQFIGIQERVYEGGI